MMTDAGQGSAVTLLNRFRCLGAECEDTCCRGWDMQMNPAMTACYQKEKPSLLLAVEETPHGMVMRRTADDACVRLEQGICSIHRDEGANWLGDACYFYPRSTRSVGGRPVQSAAMSCPEVARLGLSDDAGWGYADARFERLPEALRSYGLDGADASESMVVVQAFLDMALGAASPSQLMADVVSVSRSLDSFSMAQWPAATPFYARTASQRRMEAEAESADIYRLLQGVVLLLGASGKRPSARLSLLLAAMEQALQCTVRWQDYAIHLVLDEYHEALPARFALLWQEHEALLAPFLRRWVMGQISLHLHPYGGLGASPYQRAQLMAMHYATLRLVLLCRLLNGEAASVELVVSTVQPLARLMDHLSLPDVWLAFAADHGWDREKRLVSLL